MLLGARYNIGRPIILDFPINSHEAVWLTWQLFLLNLVTFELPIASLCQKQLATILATFPVPGVTGDFWNFGD